LNVFIFSKSTRSSLNEKDYTHNYALTRRSNENIFI